MKAFADMPELIIKPALWEDNGRSFETKGVGVVRHALVYHEPGIFAAWPANEGMWRWGDEMAVSFLRGHYKYHEKSSHAYDRGRTIQNALARTRDGGETWTVDADPQINRMNSPETAPLPDDGIRFGHPDFALKVRSSVWESMHSYMVSYDRGHSWEGPYALPEAEEGCELTGRTDYIVDGPKSCILILSRKQKGVELSDRSFAVRTDDGGKTWSRLGDLTDDAPRSVMTSTVRLPGGALVSAIRRRQDTHFQTTGTPEPEDGTAATDGQTTAYEQNWIEVRRSSDGGRTWKFLSRAAETSQNNGNPPAMALLADGRLALVYALRVNQPAVMVKMSGDGGLIWSGETTLRADIPGELGYPRRKAGPDGRKVPIQYFDIGYPCVAARPDGSLVAVYYYTAKDRPETHIEATIWKP